ncbi:hypothetical protein AB4043_07365, partial [Terriglobus sp. YAF25]
MRLSLYRLSCSILLLATYVGAHAQTAASPTTPVRPPAPTRDPHTAGYVEAKDLADGELPPADQDGNFILGPTHQPAPEAVAHEGIPHGDVGEFVLSSADSKIYPGIARELSSADSKIYPGIARE